MQYSEIKAIAQSVAKWVWQRDKLMRKKFIERQRWKGERGGKASGEARLLASEDKRVTARLMHAKGIKQQEIADELGVSRMTIHRWISNVT